MVHLRIKEVTEYTGPETYVRDMLAKVRTRGRGRGRVRGRRGLWGHARG